MELTVRADNAPARASGRGAGAPRDRPAGGDLQQPRPGQRVPPMAGRPGRAVEGLRRALRAARRVRRLARAERRGLRPQGPGPLDALVRRRPARPAPGSGRPGGGVHPVGPTRLAARGPARARRAAHRRPADPRRDRQGIRRRAGLRRRDGGRPGGPWPDPQRRRRPAGPGRPARMIAIVAPRPGPESTVVGPLAWVEVRTAPSPPAARRTAATGSGAAGTRTSSTPGPGEPASNVLAATVIAGRSSDADALATILNVLPPAEGLRLADTCRGSPA